jgi:hypothetical protein
MIILCKNLGWLRVEGRERWGGGGGGCDVMSKETCPGQGCETGINQIESCIEFYPK